ncbi:MAG: ATP-binding protein, partial [Bacteroidota bacterium]
VKSRSTLADFKEVKLAREALIEKARLLETTNGDLEAFTYSVSHDLRAPLRAIDGFTRILTEDYAAHLDEEGIKVAGVIRDNTQRMGQLIDDLLAFSKLGRTEMHKANVSMRDLVEECLKELHTRNPVSEIVTMNGSLPVTRADRSMMKQVWINLLSNAVKFSSGSPNPAIDISCTTDQENTVFAIKDNGVGFDMQYRDKLFGVFQRLHSQKEFEGTGVGLAIVHRIIDRHGGKVWAESQPGHGATFYFSLTNNNHS